MVILFWDASALAKKYSPELGSNVVEELFQSLQSVTMVSSTVSYVEVISVLLRKFNRNSINRQAYDAARIKLRNELMLASDVTLLSIDDDAVFGGIAVMEQYNLNSTDAILVYMFEKYIQSGEPDDSFKFVLVSADERMLRAWRTRGRQGINPETVDPFTLSELLSST